MGESGGDSFLIGTGILSCLNILMEDKRPATGTGGDRIRQKTQTLIFTYGKSVNAKIGVHRVICQIAEVMVEVKQLPHLNSLSLSCQCDTVSSEHIAMPGKSNFKAFLPLENRNMS